MYSDHPVQSSRFLAKPTRRLAAWAALSLVAPVDARKMFPTLANRTYLPVPHSWVAYGDSGATSLGDSGSGLSLGSNSNLCRNTCGRSNPPNTV